MYPRRGHGSYTTPDNMMYKCFIASGYFLTWLLSPPTEQTLIQLATTPAATASHITIQQYLYYCYYYFHHHRHSYYTLFLARNHHIGCELSLFIIIYFEDIRWWIIIRLFYILPSPAANASIVFRNINHSEFIFYKNMRLKYINMYNTVDLIYALSRNVRCF